MKGFPVAGGRKGRKTLDLSGDAGEWRVACAEPGEGLASGYERPEFPDEGWTDAPVPGDVHQALRRRGVTYGIFDGRGEREDSGWIERKEWWYRRSFFLPEGFGGCAPVRLTFDGLDTLAAVYLNGREVLRHENMFTPASADVSGGIVRGGRNVLAVRFDPPVLLAEKRGREGLFSCPSHGWEKMHVRKAQLQTGWDFYPRRMACGIWKPARIEVVDGPVISRIKLLPRLAGPRLALRALAKLVIVEAEVRIDGPCPKGACVELRAAGRWARAKVKGGRARLVFEISRPRPWWPREFGRPHLYTAEARLVEGGRTLDRARERFGVRSVELLRERTAGGGEGFAFRINGRRIFVKGANWVPPRFSLAEISLRDYRDLLELALHGNINMLRVWGGGIYLDDSFYSLCDELGIMVWQDFMFACSVYPQDEKFLANVRAEAEHWVDRLASHPSLVVWCGGNETDWAYDWAKKDGFFERSFTSDLVSRRVLPEAVESADGTRPYIPSSPHNPHGEWVANNEDSGNVHEYEYMMLRRDEEGRPGKKRMYYRDYVKYRGKFISEFGATALPGAPTLSRYDFFKKRALYERGAKKGRERPDERTVDLSQLKQAFVVEYKIRRTRVRKDECGGLLYWKFNDPFDAGTLVCPACWMSAVLYPDGPRPLFYVARRAYGPVCIVVLDEPDGTFALAAASDLDREVKLSAGLSLQTFEGEEVGRWSARGTIPPDGVVRLLEDVKVPAELVDRTVFFAEAREGRTVLDRHTFFPAELGRLLETAWPRTKLRLRARKGAIIIDCAGPMARWVQLECSSPAVIFDEGAFDLPAGAGRVIRPILTRGISKRDVLDAQVRVRAMNADTVRLDLCEVLGGERSRTDS